MSTAIPPTMLATYLNMTFDDAETARAQMLIDHAVTQALSIVMVGDVPTTGPTEANLPTGADSVILPAVSRIFLNPAGLTSENAGPFSGGRSAGTGSMFSKAERATLRRLAGQSAGAFTIDPTPASAMQNYADPLGQPTQQEVFEYLEETGFMS